MFDEKVDLVAGDFNGAARRRATKIPILSIIEEAFTDCELPCLLAPYHCVSQDGSRYVGRRVWIHQTLGFRWKMESSSAWSILHSPRSSGHLADRSELPSRGMKPPGFLCNGAMVKRIKKDTNDDSSRKNARRRVLQTKLQNAPSQEYFFDSSVPNRSCFFLTSWASTSGIQDPDVEKRVLSRNKVEWNGRRAARTAWDCWRMGGRN